jgi:hypothetical protein
MSRAASGTCLRFVVVVVVVAVLVAVVDARVWRAQTASRSCRRMPGGENENHTDS